MSTVTAMDTSLDPASGDWHPIHDLTRLAAQDSNFGGRVFAHPLRKAWIPPDMPNSEVTE